MSLRVLIAMFLSAFFTISVNAQQTVWERSIVASGYQEDYPASCLEDAEGNFYLVNGALGYTYVTKLTPQFNVIWQKKYAGKYKRESWGPSNADCAAFASDGNLLICSTLSGDHFRSGAKTQVLKIRSKSGTVMFNAAPDVAEFDYSMKVARNGDIVLRGDYLYRLSPTAQILNRSLARPENLRNSPHRADSLGNYYYYDNVIKDGTPVFTIAKYDPDGHRSWTYKSNVAVSLDGLQITLNDTDGKVVVTSFSQHNGGVYARYMSISADTGGVDWITENPIPGGNVFGSSTAFSKDGLGLYVSCQNFLDAQADDLTKIDPATGTILWRKVLSHPQDATTKLLMTQTGTAMTYRSSSGSWYRYVAGGGSSKAIYSYGYSDFQFISNDNYLVSPSVFLAVNSTLDIRMLKFNMANNNELARYDFGTYGAFPNLSFSKVIKCPDGGFVVIGITYPDSARSFVSRLNVDGTERWQILLPDNGIYGPDVARATVGQDGSVYIANVSRLGNNNYQTVFRRLRSSDGTIEWTNTLVGNYQPPELCVDDNENLFVSGSTGTNSYFLASLSTVDGQIVWNVPSPVGKIFSFKLLSTGDLVATSSAGLSRIDPSGSIVWSTNVGVVTDWTIRPNDGIFVCTYGNEKALKRVNYLTGKITLSVPSYASTFSMDNQGYLYQLAPSDHLLYKISTTDGAVVRTTGGPSVLADDQIEIVADEAGKIYGSSSRSKYSNTFYTSFNFAISTTGVLTIGPVESTHLYEHRLKALLLDSDNLPVRFFSNYSFPENETRGDIRATKFSFP